MSTGEGRDARSKSRLVKVAVGAVVALTLAAGVNVGAGFLREQIAPAAQEVAPEPAPTLEAAPAPDGTAAAPTPTPTVTEDEGMIAERLANEAVKQQSLMDRVAKAVKRKQEEAEERARKKRLAKLAAEDKAAGRKPGWEYEGKASPHPYGDSGVGDLGKAAKRQAAQFDADMKAANERNERMFKAQRKAFNEGVKRDAAEGKKRLDKMTGSSEIGGAFK